MRTRSRQSSTMKPDERRGGSRPLALPSAATDRSALPWPTSIDSRTCGRTCGVVRTFSTGIETPTFDLTVFKLHFGRLTGKAYTKDEMCWGTPSVQTLVSVGAGSAETVNSPHYKPPISPRVEIRTGLALFE